MTGERESTFQSVSGAVARCLGLRIEESDLADVTEQLLRQASKRGLAGPGAYLRRLWRDAEELSWLARTVTVTETYFFRHETQFRAIERLLRPGMRILSAGCASGEEPYSLALLARERLPEAEAASITIHAIDVNDDALEQARRARYRPWSLRNVPAQFRKRYFREAGGRFLLDAAIREAVTFERRNLAAEDPQFWAPSSFDLILCRNVLMYFVPEAAEAALRRFERSIPPGGHLFLSHAENLRGLSAGFVPEVSEEAFYYQRAPAGPRASEPRQRREGGAAVPRKRRAREPARRRVAPTPAPGRSRSAPPAESGAEQLRRALQLAGAAEAEVAEAETDRLLRADDLDPAAHLIKALCRDQAGDARASAEHARAAAYLDPDFAMPHLQLGILARREGDLARARRELELALELLRREDARRLALLGGGLSREQWVRVCRSQLRACREET